MMRNGGEVAHFVLAAAAADGTSFFSSLFLLASFKITMDRLCVYVLLELSNWLKLHLEHNIVRDKNIYNQIVSSSI